MLELIESGEPLNKATNALILLHGRGSNAEDILTLADFFDLTNYYVVAPQAPNNRWYPNSFMADDHSNEPFLTNAVNEIKKIIDDITKYIPTSQICLMGFSQGACLSLEVSSRFACKYKGIVAFSGGLIGKTINTSKYHGNFNATKVFIGNSDIDPHIPLSRSKESLEIMQKMGADVTLKVYPGMNHSINEDEIQWVKENIIT